MKHICFCILLVAGTPVQAEEDSLGRDLMGQALELFMESLVQEMEPALQDLTGLLEDFDAYHLPEVLPNGDIIIRRKRPDEPVPEEIEI